MHAPTSVHWPAAKRVLRYLKGSLYRGILFSKDPFDLDAFCDLDLVGSFNYRRSILDTHSSLVPTSPLGVPKYN